MSESVTPTPHYGAMNGHPHSAEQLARTSAVVDVGLVLVEAIRAAGPTAFIIRDEIGLVHVTCTLAADSLTALQPHLAAAADAQHRVAATVRTANSEVAITWHGGGGHGVELSGDANELVPQREVGNLTRAATLDDGGAVLSSLGRSAVDLEVVVRAPATGATWVRTADLLRQRLADGRWGSTLTQLTNKDGGNFVVVLISDAGTDVLYTPALVMAGPDAVLGRDPGGRSLRLVEGYRSRASFQQRADILLPGELVCDDPATGTLAGIDELLASAARASTWYWIAESATLESERVLVRFEGVTSIELELRPYGSGSPKAEVALAEWALATGEASRAESVQQAVTFAVRTPGDLDAASGPVLRTARSLYELAGRGLVSEALAARRAARESALTAARAAASTAREVATKAVERALALLVAAAVAVFARSQDLISDGVSYAFVIAISSLAIAALLVAVLVDIRSGKAVIGAFRIDVELYRDTLGEDDIEATKGIAAIREAHEDLHRAGITAGLMYLAVLGAVMVGGLFFISSNADGASTPAPVPTQSPSAQPTETPLLSPTPTAAP